MRLRSLVAFVGVACVSSLREEMARLDLEVEAEKNQVTAKLQLSEQQPAAGKLQLPELQEPEALSRDSCQHGLLTLKDKMVVKDKFVFPKDCRRVLGEAGAEVVLEEPVEFEGELQFEGEIRIRAARAFQQACLKVHGNVSVLGKLLIQNCWNEKGEDAKGGGLHVGGTLLQHNGAMEFRNCSSGDRGGGLFAEAGVTQRNGTMEFRNCTSSWLGGGLYVWGMMQHNGTMEFHNCSSQYGGGLYVNKDMTQQEGTMEFHNCSSWGDGGGLYVSGEMTQPNGTMKFHNCSSWGDGGGLYVGQMTQQNGTMEFHNCSSRDGGGLYVGQMTQHNGTMEFHNCSSKKSGGGLYVWGMMQHNGTMEFHNCSSERSGGGLYVNKDMTQQEGTMEFHDCSSGDRGGCLHVDNQMTQRNGTMEFHNCSSKVSGGGLFVSTDMTQHDGTMEFRNCSSGGDGGGFWVEQFEATGTSSLLFAHCSATRGGGVFAMTSMTVNVTETMRFQQCEAAQSGGGVQIGGKQGSFLSAATFEKCSAARSTAIEARNLTVKNLELVDTFQKAVDSQSLQIDNLTFSVSAEFVKAEPVAIEAVNLTIASDINCTQLRTCQFISSSPPKLGELSCPVGTGVPKRGAFGCLACPEGQTQVERETNSSCVACPNGTAVCRAGRIQMAPGLMVHDRDLSRSLHCPTKAACRGGELPATDTSQEMCQPGYCGEGCAQCAQSENGVRYLTADSSVLACTLCANNTMMQLMQWCMFLAQRSVLYALSAASIFGAGRADAVKNSGVFLNQLMAFAAVSGSVVTAVMQTATAQSMKTTAVESLYGTAVFLSETGSGQGSRSSHCLLSYISLEETGLYGVHCLDLGIATILVLLLSLKDFRVALVAGINCFLPGVLADFAKYAVCYKMEANEGLICRFLPFGNIFGFIVVGCGFLTFFTIALFIWIRLSTSKEASGKDDLPSYLAFLINKYNEDCRYFEAERLVRKVLLTSVAAFYPSSAYPELQMTALTVITTTSLIAYSAFQPYRRQLWNWSEFALLGTAQLLICGASAVMWNEGNWDKTDSGQKFMIVTLGAIVTGVCSLFMFQIALEFWRERRPAAHSQ